jgi:4-hydroxythreonine-4-phosphate dehydrogenase
MIGITLGDPTGIGPEVVVRALCARHNLDVVVFGDQGVVDRARAAMATAPGAPAWSQRTRIEPVTSLSLVDATPGRPGVVSGHAQVAYLEAAVRAAREGRIGAIVTAPISKHWAATAGFAFPGHTEYLADAFGTNDFAMMLAGPRLRVTVTTTHMALRNVAGALTAEGITRATVLTARALAFDFGVASPRVAVAGLNPHAGEEGRFGDEEARLVVPAVAEARRRLAAMNIAATITGPHVPDVVFRSAADGAFDAVVALYHDQGLIPVKLLDFDEAVNVTLGLPVVRTSPDHGTAYDIAGTGRARATSFLAALDLAARLAKR